MIFSFYVLRFKTELKLFTPFFSKYKKHNLLNWPPNFSVAIDFSRSGNSSLTEVQAPSPFGYRFLTILTALKQKELSFCFFVYLLLYLKKDRST